MPTNPLPLPGASLGASAKAAANLAPGAASQNPNNWRLAPSPSVGPFLLDITGCKGFHKQIMWMMPRWDVSKTMPAFS